MGNGFGPWPGSASGGGPSTLPRFQLALSYGQGGEGNADLNAGESFWFQPQGIVNGASPDQVHEWPVARELLFIGLTVFVDAAEIVLEPDADPPRFIITIDGVDTIFQRLLGAGTHTDELVEVSGVVDIVPGSRIGVRFAGAGVAAGSSLRCEMILDGAETGVPIPPPPIPTNGLLLDLPSENYVITPTVLGGSSDWTDDSGNSNDMFHGNTELVHLPAITPAVFNDHPGISFDRVQTTEMQNTGAITWHGANDPRTFVAVIRGGNLSPGCVLSMFNGSGLWTEYTMVGNVSPQIIEQTTGVPTLIENAAPFFDLNGERAILMWWTSGAIGDPWHFTVNAVEATLTGTVPDELADFNGLRLGFDNDVFFPDSLRFAGDMGRLLAWNRVLTPSERIGVLANLTEGYL